MKVVMGQLNTFVGDVAGNTEKVIEAAQATGAEEGAVLLVFPELTLTGYPPEDLLMRDSLHLFFFGETARVLVGSPPPTPH